MRQSFNRQTPPRLLLLLSLLLLGGCAHGPAPEAPQVPPTLILISLDGFRWDFLDHAPTPHLDRLVADGVRAERMIPVFPSKTFPNHYTLVTGLWPRQHGILANTFYDPVFDARFSLSDREAVADGRWWGGEPIWVTAERQGQRAATLFWPGSEAAISGVRPSDWLAYDGDLPNPRRVEILLEWLDRPAAERPTFLTLYLSDVDSTAHRHGPDAPETARAVQTVDAVLGQLLAGLDRRGLTDRIDLLVVADHGMAAISLERLIFLDDFVDPAVARPVDWSPALTLWPGPEQVEEVYRSLVDAHPHLRVFRREEIPERFHYRGHRRTPPILGLADEGWTLTTHRRFQEHPERLVGGAHGYDPELPSMGALFIAHGPSFQKGATIEPFENIHVYELICQILGLRPAPNSGDWKTFEGVLQKRFLQ